MAVQLAPTQTDLFGRRLGANLPGALYSSGNAFGFRRVSWRGRGHNRADIGNLGHIQHESLLHRGKTAPASSVNSEKR